ncbi:ABC transporter ATP-binding protein [Candidatus Saccharibacteria bacterium]|nr:ABC transporter ATP-binding protein [Candidatus Saccharibacteria bacterium]
MPGPRGREGQKPKDLKKAISRFMVEAKPFKVPIIIAIVLSVLSVLFTVFGPMVLGLMTTSATTSIAEGKGINWGEVGFLALLLLTLYVVSGIINYIKELLLMRTSAKFSKLMRAKILSKISRLPISYFDKIKIGDIMSRMTNDVDAVSMQLAATISDIVTSIVTIVGILAMMLLISVPLSLVAIIAIPVSMIFVKRVAEKAQGFFKKQRTILGELNSRIEEDYTGQLIIKANTHEKATMSEFQAKNKALYEASWKSQFFGSLPFPITHIFTHLAYILICILGGFFAIAGKITIGNVQAFIQYVGQFNRPITEVAQLSATIQQIMAAAERVFDFLDADELPKEDFEPAFGSSEEVSGEVEFHDVSFSYDKEKPVIKNFSAKIEPGMQVAIVGPTGAGKTTIVNLLMRFYEPDSGYITIDGKPIREMKRSEVRKLFGMVLQDTWLFSGTIMNNLKYGAGKNIPDEEVHRAIKTVSIEHFIDSLPKGLETEIDEDSDNISAGEKQLLTIARAMVAEPPMMILDEATSNVDTRTEQMIQDAFAKLTKGRTSFVIAHRLSTIRNSDLILVMKDGNIIEQGKHDELLAMNGFYAELYNSQFSDAE